MKNLKYNWKKGKDYPKKNGLKVFGTFVCGGGSTMGYKLAPLKLDFYEASIPFGEIADKGSTTHRPLWPSIIARLPFVEKGDQDLKFADAKYRGLKTHNAFFSTSIFYDNEVPGALTSSGASVYYEEMRSPTIQNIAE